MARELAKTFAGHRGEAGHSVMTPANLAWEEESKAGCPHVVCQDGALAV